MVGGVSIGNDWHIVPLRGALGPSQKRLLIFPFVENDDDLSANIWLHRPPMTLHRSVRSHFSNPPPLSLTFDLALLCNNVYKAFSIFFESWIMERATRLSLLYLIGYWILYIEYCNTIFYLRKFLNLKVSYSVKLIIIYIVL